MAHNPKLEVFKIYLKPTNEKRDVTFKVFIKEKFKISDDDNSVIYNCFFDNFIKTIDDKDFIKDKNNNKAFTAYDTETDINNPANNTIRLHSISNFIEGIVEGGRYGQSRNKSDINNKQKKEKLPKDSIILDKFYFYLYTPLDNNVGIIMLQSYSEDSIRDIFLGFLKKVFSGDGFFNPNIEPYTPKKFIEEFKKGATLKSISFTKDILISNSFNKSKTDNLEEFNIRIEIKPKGKNKSLTKITSILKKLRSSKFNEKNLVDFSTRIFLDNVTTEKSAYYDLEKDLDNIKPMIYLENRITIDNDGIPKFDELKDYCTELLETLKNELYLINKVNEC